MHRTCGCHGDYPFPISPPKMDPKFTYKDTNWKSRLNSPRPDWLQEHNHNDFFTVKPHVIVDNVRGLCVATCKFHNGGSGKQFVHPPANPTGRLPNKFPDRLGPATVTYNCYKPTKPIYSTHTYAMGIAKGSFAGISSTTISLKRKWMLRLVRTMFPVNLCVATSERTSS